MSKTYTLVEPIVFAGRKIETLEFRAPKGRDIMEIGNPFDLVTGASSTAVLGGMIGRLSGVEQIIVEQLSLTDWNGCAASIASFLQAPGKIS